MVVLYLSVGADDLVLQTRMTHFSAYFGDGMHNPFFLVHKIFNNYALTMVKKQSQTNTHVENKTAGFSGCAGFTI